ncbi:MAG: hypothetical protein U0223_15030 [Nitrospira sp.]|nr:hypothetical protein [Nitrospira sp.]
MAETAILSVDSIMCRKIAGIGTCTFDELVRRLPTYPWAQVFSAVDRLSRQGSLSVRRMRGVDYVGIHRAGFSRSRVFARPGVPSRPISGDPIRRRALNRDMA